VGHVGSGLLNPPVLVAELSLAGLESRHAADLGDPSRLALLLLKRARRMNWLEESGDVLAGVGKDNLGPAGMPLKELLAVVAGGEVSALSASGTAPPQPSRRGAAREPPPPEHADVPIRPRPRR